MELTSGGHHQGTALREYLRVLRRRGWIVVLVVAVVTASAVLLSVRQDKLYSSSAEVLLRPTTPVGIDPRSDAFSGSSAQAERYVQTQVKIARLAFFQQAGEVPPVRLAMRRRAFCRLRTRSPAMAARATPELTTT